jgi:excisionase family DNA binding protein
MARQIQTVRPGSLKYAAARIGVSLPILYALIKAGKLRSYHIGRAHRVSEQSIADCIALLESENQDRPASSPRRRLLGVDSANDRLRHCNSRSDNQFVCNDRECAPAVSLICTVRYGLIIGEDIRGCQA